MKKIVGYFFQPTDQAISGNYHRTDWNKNCFVKFYAYIFQVITLISLHSMERYRLCNLCNIYYLYSVPGSVISLINIYAWLTFLN